MKKITFLLTALLLFGFSNAFAQTLSEPTSYTYDWNTGENARDISYYNGMLYVIDKGTQAVHVINPADGTVSEVLSDDYFSGFSVTHDDAGNMYVTNGGWGMTASIKGTLIVGETSTSATTSTATGRIDYVDAYGDFATSGMLAGATVPGTGSTIDQIAVWKITNGAFENAAEPIIFTDARDNFVTDADIKWINDTTMLVTGRNSIPAIVTLDFDAGTATSTPIGTAAYPAGGGTYFEIAGVPYAVFPTDKFGSYEVLNISDPANPVKVEENTTPIGSTATGWVNHVAFEAVVEGNTATIYTWSINNGLLVQEFEGPPTKTFTVTAPEGTEKVYIVGGFGEQDGPTWWNVDEPFELTPTGNPNEFSGTFPCGDDIEYKYLSNPGNWDYQEAVSLDPMTEGGNRTYNEADVIANWKAQPQVKLSVSLDADYDGEVPTTLSVKGSWNDWGEPITLTKEGDTFVGTIGNGTTDLIYSNMQYKYIIPGATEAEDNWEFRTEEEGNRWAIYPQMNDVIAGFEKEVLTGLNQVVTEISLLRTPTGIVVEFDGQADIELYGINGQLIDKTRALNSYSRDLNRGTYIIRVNGASHKFVR